MIRLLKEYKNEIFNSNNIFLILLSVTVFIFFELLFYWFIISNQIEYILNDKAMIIVLAAQDNSAMKQSVLSYVQNKNTPQSEVDALRNSRIASNYDAMMTLLGPMFFTVVGLLCLIIIYKIVYYVLFKKNTMTYIFGYTVFLTMFVFLVEIIFYYIVINPYKLISDAEFISIITGSPPIS